MLATFTISAHTSRRPSYLINNGGCWHENECIISSKIIKSYDEESQMDMITGSNAASLENMCTCKICNHSLARDCIDANRSCCTRSNHSMIVDGIEGFRPEKGG
jgi:hypothetical protein